MAQRTKQAYLLTSPEKFQQEDGNGSSSMGSRTRTGAVLLDGANVTSDLSSPSETPSSSQSGAISPEDNPAVGKSDLEDEAKALYELEAAGYGIPWESLADNHSGVKAQYINRVLTKRRYRHGNGGSTEIDVDMLQFWSHRRFVQSKQ